MASASTPATSSTTEATNFARLCRLIVDEATSVLRNVFDGICPPSALGKLLSKKKPDLRKLKLRRIINATQWEKLYPIKNPASVSSRNFDITLFGVLFRNICSLASPKAGWFATPASTDMSRAADILRVIGFRNTLSHREHASVDDATFHKQWKEIQDTLVRLGGVKDDIDKLQVDCMDPNAAKRYIEVVREWKNDDDDTKVLLKGVDKKVDLIFPKLDSMMSTMTSTSETSYQGVEKKIDLIFPKLESMMSTMTSMKERSYQEEESSDRQLKRNLPCSSLHDAKRKKISGCTVPSIQQKPVPTDSKGGDHDFEVFLSAIKGENIESIELMLLQGLDIDSRDSNGHTALMMAALCGKPDAFDCLIKHGANSSLKNNLGFSLLHMALQGNSMSIMSIFHKVLSLGPDIDSTSNTGVTPLMVAAVNDNLEAFNHLIKLDANPHLIDYSGWGLLHHAAVGGNISIVAYLLTEIELDINLRDKKGNTPAMLAAEAKNSECANYLMDKKRALDLS